MTAHARAEQPTRLLSRRPARHLRPVPDTSPAPRPGSATSRVSLYAAGLAIGFALVALVSLAATPALSAVYAVIAVAAGIVAWTGAPGRRGAPPARRPHAEPTTRVDDAPAVPGRRAA